MHPGAPAEPVLATWGIDIDGKFVGLAPASSESTDAWGDFLARAGGPGHALAAAWHQRWRTPGLTGLFDRAFTTTLRQRCLVHLHACWDAATTTAPSWLSIWARSRSELHPR